jgi:hypothetical protein
MNSHAHTLLNGITGILASAGSVLTTFQTQLEWWVRMTGSFVGLLIALISLWNLVKPKK